MNSPLPVRVMELDGGATDMGTLETLVRPLRYADAPERIVRRIHTTLTAHDVHMPVRLWDGTEIGPADAGFRVVLNHPWSLRAMLIPPNDLSAGEAYLFGDVDVEGSMIAALHAVRPLHAGPALGLRTRVGLLLDVISLPPPPPRHRGSERERRVRLRGRSHSVARDEQAVRHHYDLGNDFYRLFLDPELVYSCAYFHDDDPLDPAADPQALDRAQVRKLDLICRKLGLTADRTLLDIGCGWGSLILHAARSFGARAVGITLSTEQAALARERIAEAGVADRVEVRVQDYRDVTGTFDAVASVGMFEHVGEPRFRTYFAKAVELTAPGGRFLNHAITTGQRDQVSRLSADAGSFVGAYVFPDGTLAPAHVAVRLMEQAGFELIDVQQLRPHYARTLRHWVHNLETNAAGAREVAGEPAFRTWRAYMSGSVVGFETNGLGVVQVLGAKPETGRPAGLPLGRAWMEPPF